MQWPQANYFFRSFCYFWVGRYNKTLNDWPLGKQWVLFPLDLNVPLGFASGNIHCFPCGQSLSAYCFNTILKVVRLIVTIICISISIIFIIIIIVISIIFIIIIIIIIIIIVIIIKRG